MLIFPTLLGICRGMGSSFWGHISAGNDELRAEDEDDKRDECNMSNKDVERGAS